MALAYGRKEIYHDDQMVVALDDRRLVDQTLDLFKVRILDFQPHEALGLGLLTLDSASITPAVESLMADPASQVGRDLAAYRDTEADRLKPLPVTGLDLLLKALRLYFHYENPEWAGPRIGKNRGINTLSGAPEIGPGSVGDPERSQKALVPRSRPLAGRLSGSATGHDGTGVQVGQIDGPIYPHLWLAGAYIAAPGDVVPVSAGYQVNQGHATSVASCILDIAPAAQIHLRRVLDENGTGDMWTAATKMAELAELGCDVVNVSVGQCFSDDGKPPLVLDSAVRLLSARSLIIAAAGNHGNVNDNPCQAMPGLTPTSVYYPVGCEDVIAVGALGQDKKEADFTPKNAPYISLMASGTGVTVAYLDGHVTIQHHCQDLVETLTFDGWATVSGTSYSAAIVTGEIARRTVPGKKTAKEALDELLTAQRPIRLTNPRGGVIRPA